MSPSDPSAALPRVLIVSRRTLRKNKFVDFVGEYHLDLIIGYGAVPVIVPRVAGIHLLLDSFEPIHGVLLCEGEDIDPSHYRSDSDDGESDGNGSNAGLSEVELDEIRLLHPSDAAIDREKDSIEFRLARLCVERNIPYLGICRGSQVLNVACGGTLFQDIEKEHSRNLPENQRTVHMDYGNYDGHRHPVRVVEGTPLADWFGESLGEGGREMEIRVNSYHHQGVRRLARRFVPMAFSPDGLVEGFYDPGTYNPIEGKFIMGLQFHPERMRQAGTDKFDYPGCPSAYQEFVKAVIAYQKKLSISTSSLAKPIALDREMEKKRKIIVRSFSLARDIYTSRCRVFPPESELKAGAEFLESNMVLSMQMENKQMHMGETARNTASYFQGLRMNEETKSLARSVMGKMTAEQLSDLVSFYQMMGKLSCDILQTKRNMVNVDVVPDQLRNAQSACSTWGLYT